MIYKTGLRLPSQKSPILLLFHSHSPRIAARKWGSCSTRGIVTLAADLADQQTGFQDFVIAHELLHLRVPNHGRLFKRHC